MGVLLYSTLGGYVVSSLVDPRGKLSGARRVLRGYKVHEYIFMRNRYNFKSAFESK